jgi:hypothetical protein
VFSGAPGCTTNATVFNSSGDGLNIKSLMAGCYRSQLTVSVSVLYYGEPAGLDQGPLICRNSTQCELPTHATGDNLAPGVYTVTVEGCSSAYTRCDSVTKGFYVAN